MRDCFQIATLIYIPAGLCDATHYALGPVAILKPQFATGRDEREPCWWWWRCRCFCIFLTRLCRRVATVYVIGTISHRCSWPIGETNAGMYCRKAEHCAAASWFCFVCCRQPMEVHELRRQRAQQCKTQDNQLTVSVEEPTKQCVRQPIPAKWRAHGSTR